MSDRFVTTLTPALLLSTSPLSPLLLTSLTVNLFDFSHAPRLPQSAMPVSTAAASTAPVKRSSKRAIVFGTANSASWIKKKVDTSYLHTLTFGRPNRPSTPIYGVITGQYGREAEQRDREEKLRRERKAQRQSKEKDVRAQHTLASLGHMKVEREADRERFVMARFDGVQKRVVTKWDVMPGRRGDKVEKEAEVEEQKEQLD